jgi:alpha-glucoside transport system substrate-binding protein
MRGLRFGTVVAAASAVTLLTSGCLSSGDSGGDSGEASGPGKKTIEIMFGFGGDQTQGFKDALEPYAKANGLTIKYTQSDSFDTQIRTRQQGNNLPDIALFPQPGLLKDIQKRAQGKMVELDSILDIPKIKDSMVPGIVDAAAVGGKTYGVPVSMNVKSLVFYPKKAFEAKGYAAPKTLAELTALADKIKADGTAPWCVGLESGAATGWPGTDWIEELVLKQLGPDKYDQWVAGELDFSSPEVKGVFQTYEKLILTEGQTLGGRKSIVSTAFQTAANPMFENPPKCFLHRQGNFVTQKGFFPDAVWSQLEANVGVFPFPKDRFDTVLGGGDLAAAFTKDANVVKVMKEMTENPKFGEVWASEGDRGFLSPHKSFDVSKYANSLTRGIAEGAYASSGMRFDGSDAMPGTVGAGTFWKGMVAFTSGQQDLDATLKGIDDSWPAS